jgi:hypothetical protein
VKKHDPKQNELASEFQEFLRVSPVLPPAALSEIIFETVSADLNPGTGRLLGKLIALHIPAGALSLLVCSQFGIGNETILTHRLMSLGEFGCFAFCGAIFLGVTGLTATLVLSRAELKAMRRLFYSPIVAIGAFSLAMFFLLGAEVTSGPALAWLVGGLLAAVFIIESGLKTFRL